MSEKIEHCRRKAILSKHSSLRELHRSRQRQAFRNLSIRMVAGFAGIIERKEVLVAGVGFEPTTSGPGPTYRAEIKMTARLF
jgi:hypothetical protein